MTDAWEGDGRPDIGMDGVNTDRMTEAGRMLPGDRREGDRRGMCGLARERCWLAVFRDRRPIAPARLLDVEMILILI